MLEFGTAPHARGDAGGVRRGVPRWRSRAHRYLARGIEGSTPGLCRPRMWRRAARRPAQLQVAMAAGAAATVSPYLTCSSWQRRQPRRCSLGRSAAPPAWPSCSGPPCRPASPAAPQRLRSAGRSWDPTASQNGSRCAALPALAVAPQPSTERPQRPESAPQARTGSPAASQALPRRHAQVSFLELISNTLGDFTIVVLIISGVASIALELAFGKAGDNGWIEGAAILAAVAVVALVTAVNDYEKEQQFRELSALSSETQVHCLALLRLSRCYPSIARAPLAACRHACAVMPCIPAPVCAGFLTARNDCEKEQQFRELSALSSETQVICGSAGHQMSSQHCQGALRQHLPACMRRHALHPIAIAASTCRRRGGAGDRRQRLREGAAVPGALRALLRDAGVLPCASAAQQMLPQHCQGSIGSMPACLRRHAMHPSASVCGIFDRPQRLREGAAVPGALSALLRDAGDLCFCRTPDGITALPGRPSAACRHACAAMPCIPPCQQVHHSTARESLGSIPACMRSHAMHPTALSASRCTPALPGKSSAACMRRHAMHPGNVWCRVCLCTRLGPSAASQHAATDQAGPHRTGCVAPVARQRRSLSVLTRGRHIC